MGTKNNVIDMTARRKAQLDSQTKGFGADESHASIFEFGARRRDILTQERRRNRRTILSNFLGAYVVLADQGLKEVTLFDVSEGGIAFDIEIESGAFRSDEELAMRVYLTKEIYVPFQVKIKNSREVREEGVFRHGTHFVSNGTSDDVLKHFVKFVEAMSTQMKKDTGDLKLPKRQS